jgi:hypothetical protein
MALAAGRKLRWSSRREARWELESRRRGSYYGVSFLRDRKIMLFTLEEILA